MPKTKNAYLRYLIIHSQVKRNRYKRGYPTKENLCDVLLDEGYKCSPSTVEKDIAFLKYERGAPLEYDRKQRCYRYTEDWEFDVPLSPLDVRILSMLIHKLEIFSDASEFRMVKDSIEKLANHFNLAHQHPSDRIDKYILFEYSKGFAGRHYLPPIYNAIYEKKEISFTHCRFESDQPTRRTICPYILKEQRNRWYVIGKEDEKPRSFGLDRICDLEVFDRHFIQDPDFYDEVFRILFDSVGVMAFGYKSQDVVLRFSASEAKYVKSLMLHRSQVVTDRDDGSIEVKMHVKVTKEFIMECILRFGNEVIVVGPKRLADEIRDIYADAIRKYS
jgi:predicted DNA-binding transcriptional regulator YafY